MDAVRKPTNIWWQATALYAACVMLVLVSVANLRGRVPGSMAPEFGVLEHHAGDGRELLQVTNGQDGSVRLYDARDGRPLPNVAVAGNR